MTDETERPDAKPEPKAAKGAPAARMTAHDGPDMGAPEGPTRCHSCPG